MPSDSQNTRRPLAVTSSPGFADWLATLGIALAVTTYQAGRLLFIGLNAGGKLVVNQRHFKRAMGAWSNGDQLWLATKYQLWQLVDVAPGGNALPGERLYLPRVAHTVGEVDMHDVVIGGAGVAQFIATRLNCVAQLDDDLKRGANFRRVWQPAWIDEHVAEDRAHVNGLALRDGLARYCTVCGETNARKGWKDNRESGGVVVDIVSNEVVARGLSMPHSPRWRDERLWVLNSGVGQLGSIDVGSGQFTPLAFCPGYLRGLAFADRWALVGLSRPRYKTFSGLGLDHELAKRNQEPQTGVMVVDTLTGTVDHWLRIEGQVVELYDVVVLPKTRRARCLSLKNDDLLRNVWVADGHDQTRQFELPKLVKKPGDNSGKVK